MIVCPVCEHAQAQGAECEVCGHRLLVHGDAADAVAPMAELEPTAQEDDPFVFADPLPGFEPTALDDAGAPAPGADAPVPDLEATAAAPVAVAAPILADLEPTAAPPIPGAGRTPAPVVVICRYCRTPALPGERLCGRCGMRLPALAGAATPKAEGEGAARVCGCGMPVAGPLCPACGARHDVDDR